MQSDRYSNSRTSTTTCKWCCTEYPVVSSRASDAKMFCQRRCEIEARFWLYELLKKKPAGS